MTISNPGFEIEGIADPPPPGSAASWDSTADSQTTETAEFNVGYGWEGFELNWDSNENGIFEFLVALIDQFSIEEEDFETEWGCLWDPLPNITGIGPGFISDFDAVNKEAARFDRPNQTSVYIVTIAADLITIVIDDTIITEDSVDIEGAAEIPVHETIIRYESFEERWLLSTLTERDLLYSLASFVLNESAISSFIITQNINDRLSLRWTDSGTIHDLDIALSHGSYTRTSMVTELNNKIKDAIEADNGHAERDDFLASVTPGGRIRLENFYTGITAGARPRMELIDPVSDSAWATLGFVPVEQSSRYIESQITDIASFDVGTPENMEDFEEEWRDNEDGKLTWGAVPSPSDLDAAEFATTPPDAEKFDSGDWTLVLS